MESLGDRFCCFRALLTTMPRITSLFPRLLLAYPPVQSAEAYYRSKAGLWAASDPVPVYLEKASIAAGRRVWQARRSQRNAHAHFASPL